jgi:hypothetical protein
MNNKANYTKEALDNTAKALNPEKVNFLLLGAKAKVAVLVREMAMEEDKLKRLNLALTIIEINK